MNTVNFKHYRVFTHPNEKAYPTVLGNPANIALVETMPTQEKCITLSQKHPKTTCVFIAPSNDHPQDFDIVWYKSGRPIQLCGHGTLAAAHFLRNKTTDVVFHSASESLSVKTQNELYTLQLKPHTFIELNDNPINAGKRAVVTQTSDGYYLVDLGSESAVRHFELSEEQICLIGSRALIVTSIASNSFYDIVFRYFAPQYGTFEDQATGSAGACLLPFWEDYFEKQTLNCYQASTNGGFFTITSNDTAVIVGGYVTEK